MNKNDVTILLASKSPRRSSLLLDAGYTVSLVDIDVEESYPDDLQAHEVAEYLSIKKNNGYLIPVNNGEVLLTADSIVVLDNVVYGKPNTREEAVDTLTKLSNKVHEVFTGVCLRSSYETKSFTEKAEIKFNTLSEEEIAHYIDTYKPYDKAGSYGIQEWIGLCKVAWIKGTMSNIMGLPMASVYDGLSNLKI
jgi:septum formation protein